MYPAAAVGNVPLFGSEGVTSVPESMPLLALLTLWGIFTAFRRRTVLRARTTAVPLIAAAVPCGIILIFGFLDDRFLGDFLPLLVVGSSVGIAGVWRRIDGSPRAVRSAFVGGAFILGLFGIAANMALASTPTGWWPTQQAVRFVKFQKSVGDVTGRPLSGYVERVRTLPKSAKQGQLFITGDCNGLYMFEGVGLHRWLTLEKASPNLATLTVTSTARQRDWVRACSCSRSARLP